MRNRTWKTIRNYLMAGGAYLFLGAVGAAAQIPPVKPAPLAKQVPQGGGACSIEKSCAEIAPQMEQTAMGASPLEENLRYLSDSIGGRVTGTAAADRAAGWAVQALRLAGVDEVHTEKYTMPVGWSEGNTRLEVLAPETFPVPVPPVAYFLRSSPPASCTSRCEPRRRPRASAPAPPNPPRDLPPPCRSLALRSNRSGTADFLRAAKLPSPSAPFAARSPRTTFQSSTPLRPAAPAWPKEPASPAGSAPPRQRLPKTDTHRQPSDSFESSSRFGFA